MISTPITLRDIEADINKVSIFLACQNVADLQAVAPVECLVICASSVLWQAETLFTLLEQEPSLTSVLVFVGGKGHSTQLMYDAVGRHHRYNDLAGQIKSLPEARVLEAMLRQHHDFDRITCRGCRILIEDQSTNCGSNATEVAKLLDRLQISTPETCVVVQDPTMSRRTIASFDKAYEGYSIHPKFLGCPLFIPQVRSEENRLVYSNVGVPAGELWEMTRFQELIVGEVWRLTDDENGYGPRGRGFIGHVDVPDDVKSAATRIAEVFHVSR